MDQRGAPLGTFFFFLPNARGRARKRALNLLYYTPFAVVRGSAGLTNYVYKYLDHDWNFTNRGLEVLRTISTFSWTFSEASTLNDKGSRISVRDLGVRCRAQMCTESVVGIWIHAFSRQNNGAHFLIPLFTTVQSSAYILYVCTSHQLAMR